MIKVLIVEDSSLAREILEHILMTDPDIEVMGTAADGEEALTFLERHRPDVITMDIHMPGMDGIEVTRRIMETKPIPIIIISTYWNSWEVDTSFRAMEAGALAVLEKPCGIETFSNGHQAKEILRTIKIMSEVRLVKRRQRTAFAKMPSKMRTAGTSENRTEVGIVAIGGSTGGPPVLQTILNQLPSAFPVPVVIVQHIAAGFIEGLARWLVQSTGYPTVVASQGEKLLAGKAYLAPDNVQMAVTADGRIELHDALPEYGLRPSVSFLFRSVAAAFGNRSLGVLLTGMGRDGAEELRSLRICGAVTIAQNKESSVIYGMPGEAVRLGGAEMELNASQIGTALKKLVYQRMRGG